ncbi:uncharacterized protein LOC121304584 [Polyodon spathula]|uniref:uncharacterized protein LOC121304584 n=1 Tax=Polyodon spathula TaxID=7913 RepID=UPI001B7DA282|nr:uncharacterized protein LOC121304584 [Polyodon spathula]
MNNRSSISWWLGQLGLSQYSKVLEREYYGLEGLLCVTDADLREAGVENQSDRELILSHIKHHNESQYSGGGSPGSHCSPAPRRVTRKHSLGSSLDLLRSPKRFSGHGFSLFRQSILPRLCKKDKTSSCIQLPTLQESQSTATSTLRQPSALQKSQSTATSTLRHPSALQESHNTAPSTLRHPSALQESQSTATSTLRHPSTLQERQSTATSTLRHPSALQERQSTATSTLRHPSALQERQSTATSTLRHPSALQERQSTATSTLRHPSARVTDTARAKPLTEPLHNR